MTFWPLIRIPFNFPEVPDDHVGLGEDDAAMLPRDQRRIDPCVAAGVPANHKHRMVERDVRAAFQCDKTSGHGQTPPPAGHETMSQAALAGKWNDPSHHAD